MRKSIEVDDRSLMALGRLAWTAMNLEDWSHALCELARREFDTHRDIGAHITDALAELATWTPSPDVTLATEWLAQAKLAMIQRNHILHSIPAQSQDGHQGLVYIHKNARSGERPPHEEYAFDEATLSTIADSIETVLAGWRNAYMATERALRVEHPRA